MRLYLSLIAWLPVYITMPPIAMGELVPKSIPQFFVQPDTRTEITFQTTPSERRTAWPFQITDYQGRSVTTGQASVSSVGAVSVNVQLPQGYYEIRFPQIDAVFGLVVLPAYQGDTDSFFCIDAGLSWLEPHPAIREGLVEVMRRIGINAARERLSLGGVNPSPGVWNWEANRNYESLRRVYAKHGLPILELMYGRVSHLGSVEGVAYHQHLAQSADAWRQVAGQFQHHWMGVEVWNEPDLVPLPPDQYVPLVKSTAYAHRQAGIAAPLGAGVFTGMAPSDYHETCAANGMLEVADFISFHTYSDAVNLPRLVGEYRRWLAESGKESMPLWLTEAGKPWTSGPSRAPRDEDTASAAAMASLAIESRAAGIARIFPFVMTYYAEGSIRNFAMMGKEVSPMRSMAAYANAIRVLSAKPYTGDLPGDAQTHAVRVFGEPGDRVIAIYMKDIAAGASIHLGVNVTRVEGVDGRELRLTSDGAVPVPDGVGFAWASEESVARLLQTQTPVSELYAIAQQPAPLREPALSLVLQHPLESEKGQVAPRRYILDKALASALPVHARVHNLADGVQHVTLQLTMPDGTNGGSRQIEVPARGSADVVWTVDASTSIDIAIARHVSITGQTSDGASIHPLAIPYVVKGNLEEHMARHALQKPMPLTDLERWEANIVSHGNMRMSVVDGFFHFDASFTKTADRWAYPRFRINERLDSARIKGVVVRGRVLKPGRNVALMLRLNHQPGFWMNEIFPADGNWHVAYLPLSGFQTMPGNPDMQNALLDIARLTAFEIGMNSRQDVNAMEVSHVIFVGE